MPLINIAKPTRPCGAARLVRRTAFLCGLALLAGCAAHQTEGVLNAPGDLPSKVELAEVPFFPQEAYQCGPASLAMALSWSGLSVRPEELLDQVYSPARQGSLPTEMIGAARRHGRVAYPITALRDLLAELGAGNPVIVLQNLGLPWVPRWHFAVVVGYDLLEEEIVLHSGTEPREVLSLGHFERTWEESEYWGLLVLPPSTLPATVSEIRFLEAVIGLERSRRWQAVAQAYGTALARWPASLGALMGLGNSRYALGDLVGAEQAFRRATEAHPRAAPAFNNLAHVLAELERRQEAILLARRAVALGGPLVNTYRTTLEELQGEKPLARFSTE